MQRSPRSAWRLVLHWTSLSPGSACGKKTEAGSPLAAGSKRKPTATSSSFQPETGPTLLSMDFWLVYMAFFWPLCMRCRDFSTWNN
uniref:Putative secreted protein n=1 Tax=Rhipicephalus microplus TaxID=6941 RepID=A0A6M2DAH3_RHIMP